MTEVQRVNNPECNGPYQHSTKVCYHGLIWEGKTRVVITCSNCTRCTRRGENRRSPKFKSEALHYKSVFSEHLFIVMMPTVYQVGRR